MFWKSNGCYYSLIHNTSSSLVLQVTGKVIISVKCGLDLAVLLRNGGSPKI